MLWNSLQSLAQALPAGDVDVGRNIDGLLMGLAEDIVEAAAEGGAAEVAEAFEGVKAVHDAMARRLPLDVETTPAYRTGQVAMAVEVLGALKDRMPSAAFTEQLQRAGNQAILALLREKEHRNVDLAQRLRKDAAQITRMLKPLRDAGVVISQKSGRDVYSRLSMAARAELEGRAVAGAAESPAERYRQRMQAGPVSMSFPRGELTRLDVTPETESAAA